MGVQGSEEEHTSYIASSCGATGRIHATTPREAIELFTYRIAGEAGRLAAALGGLDGLVFTAGVGEHDAALRAEVCRRLAWLGVVPDPAANADGKGRISTDASSIEVWIVPTDGEAVIARHTHALVAA